MSDICSYLFTSISVSSLVKSCCCRGGLSYCFPNFRNTDSDLTVSHPRADLLSAMSSAPCIRGHRSTKCNHAADRVMVPVRKPGRPLSSCACPPGKSCACGGIKVAIPRKQKCKCGLDTTDGDHAGHDEIKPEVPTPAPTPSELPTSPTRNGVYRVQKSASSLKQNGRRRSFDPAQLERMDPNSVNILNHYNTSNAGVSTASTGMSGVASHGPSPPHSSMGFVQALPTTAYQHPSLISYGPAVGYALVPIHAQLNNPAMPIVPGSQAEEISTLSTRNGAATSLSKGSVRSCCAPAPVPEPQVVQIPQTNVAPKRSCCGGGSAEDEQASPITAAHRRTVSNGGMAAQLPPSFADAKHHQHQQQQQFAVSYPHPTVFTYPPNYGTWSQPLNPATWAQLQQNPQSRPADAVFPNSMPMTPTGASAGLGTSHECSCGPGCQCVGCLAHPFNPQTLQYVGGAWDYDIDIPYSNGNNAANHNNNKAKRDNNDTSANGVNMPVAHTHGHGTNGQTPGPQRGASNEAASPQAQTPSDASGFTEELSASDFMFVNLPLFGDGVNLDTDGNACAGSMAFCPCGEDCQCVGCVIHNAKPLDGGELRL